MWFPCRFVLLPFGFGFLVMLGWYLSVACGVGGYCCLIVSGDSS